MFLNFNIINLLLYNLCKMPKNTIRIWNESIYNLYQQVKSRCNNKNHRRYKDYWWRWIKCEWSSFEEFFKDMWDSYQKWLQIDRINNNWNYNKNNCRWLTPKENSKNRRNTIYIHGLCLKDYCIKNNLNYSTIASRIYNYGWSIEKAIYT